MLTQTMVGALYTVLARKFCSSGTFAYIFIPYISIPSGTFAYIFIPYISIPSGTFVYIFTPYITIHSGTFAYIFIPYISIPIFSLTKSTLSFSL